MMADFNAASLPFFSSNSSSTINPSSSTQPGPIPQHKLAAMKAELAREEAKLNRLEIIARRPTPVVPVTLLADQEDRALDPNEPLVTDEQLWMCHELEVNGIYGLNWVMAEIAHSIELEMTKNLHGGSTWRHVIERQQDTVLLNMLCTMEFEFLRALIRGDLMHRCYTDFDFRLRVLKNHTLEKTPGNYLQMMCRPQYLPVVPENIASDIATQAGRQVRDPHCGKGFTFLELEQLHQGISDYAWDAKFAFKVDRHYQGFDVKIIPTDYRHHPSQVAYRRYFPNENAWKKIQEWQVQLYEVYVKKIQAMKKADPNDPKLKIPMMRVLYEAGWGWDIASRAGAHDDHHASNNLWTFYLALSEQLFPGKFVIQRFLINRLPRWGTEDEIFQDANTSDVGMSILASSFWFQCGLNPSPAAGGGVASRHIPKYAGAIKRNMLKVYEENPPSLFHTNLNKYDAMQEKQLKMEDARKRKHEIAQELREDKQGLLELIEEKRKEVKIMKVAVTYREFAQDCDEWDKMLAGKKEWPARGAVRVRSPTPFIKRERESTPMPEIVLPRQLVRLASTPMPENIVTPRRPARSSSVEIPLFQQRSRRFDGDEEEETQVEGGDEGEDNGGSAGVGAARSDDDMYGSAADHAGPSGAVGDEEDAGSGGFAGEDSGTDGIPSDGEDAGDADEGDGDADSDTIEVI